ncbi:type II toxin-antitoxin system HipA family toxin [Comamonas sp. JUb58]|uniref:type II toxin-antitoxin system HipA family toxin n=1 Tax=Comamonas sp. JUb58 TaxID=2485114 RepID=UPI0010E4EA34|nr:type II toxin-antitoxin system HipA family toxin [Comamonas sp. JUb58]TDS81627.1 serine/threonine-protein kinase HipA [Comamonas sp. JUb58]
MRSVGHNKALGLWMNGHRVGTWRIEAGSDVLQYDDAWVRDVALRRPLSLSLPFTPGNGPHKGEAVRFYFQNLLPDNEQILERIARRYKVGATDPNALLREIGRDCVGALQILPAGEAPPEEPEMQYEVLSEADVARLVRAVVSPTQSGDGGLDDDDFRISIAGAQEKTALLYWAGQWCRPLGATPTSHILKLPLGLIGNMQIDMRHSVENEWLCSKLVAAFGIPIAPCDMLRFEDQKVLAVERFDRSVWKEKVLVRIPQEDMCQASGVSPILKYESDGGPGVDTIMNLLMRSRNPATDRFQFFMAQLLFWMLCATDGHAKNFSIFLRPQGVFEMTPLYDVISAYPILGAGPGKLSHHKARMAMAVRSKNAHWHMNKIMRRHWEAVGERYGIRSPQGLDVRAIIDQVVEMTPDVIARVKTQLPSDFPEAVSTAIFKGLQDAANRLGKVHD